jgi:hypothetical protein
MRFMSLVRGAETKSPPPPALMEAIGKLGVEAFKSGKMGGLMASAAGARVRLAGGKITVTDGPFAESKEIIGGYAVFELNSKEAAVEEARKFMDLHRQHWPGWEGESEVRQIFGQ